MNFVLFSCFSGSDANQQQKQQLWCSSIVIDKGNEKVFVGVSNILGVWMCQQ